MNKTSATNKQTKQRLHISLQGTVQGVGFRPFVFRLATQLGLKGWILNSLQGVIIEAEGPPESLQAFLQRLQEDKPALATIHSLQTLYLDPVGFDEFEIRHSDKASGEAIALILPDLATCWECRQEIFDPHNRRYRYPFTNCTNCGPRFSIILGLPYDRPQTTMRRFMMCADCQREYDDPADRRFHAQPNACPQCGPHIELWAPDGNMLAERDEALQHTAEAIRQGQIVALKGLGGFHLLVDARDEEAVQRLRERKRREEKPLALMYPSLEQIRQDCVVAPEEEQLLLSPQSPILLLPRRKNANIAAAVAPGNPYLGVMLPYTPLHHLLLADLGFPVVATSGNISDEPICIDEQEALQRLSGIADVFLVHNRPIARHVDDSIVRFVGGRPLLLRRARGYAPLPVPLPQKQPASEEHKHESVFVSLPPILAVGAHLKNATALAMGPHIFLSQHIGDLETTQAFEAFRRVSQQLPRLYDVQPEAMICDLHPDYLSTQYARQSGLPCIAVQHHVAHILSCMAENGLSGSILGFAWDGSGYGEDGTVWGGETLRIDKNIQRVAHFRPFSLPGGEKAIKEPRRCALGVLYELYGEALWEMPAAFLKTFSEREHKLLQQMLRQKVNCPRTSSVGRLFDAAAALVGLRAVARFEGQAAMELEYLLKDSNAETEKAYPFCFHTHSQPVVVDWQPLVEALLQDAQMNVPRPIIAARFHNALAQIVVDLAVYLGSKQIALSGGCFQNKYLTERVIALARNMELNVYWHQNVPPNDGGIALGQIMYARYYAGR